MIIAGTAAALMGTAGFCGLGTAVVALAGALCGAAGTHLWIRKRRGESSDPHEAFRRMSELRAGAAQHRDECGRAAAQIQRSSASARLLGIDANILAAESSAELMREQLSSRAARGIAHAIAGLADDARSFEDALVAAGNTPALASQMDALRAYAARMTMHAARISLRGDALAEALISACATAERRMEAAEDVACALDVMQESMAVATGAIDRLHGGCEAIDRQIARLGEDLADASASVVSS